MCYNFDFLKKEEKYKDFTFACIEAEKTEKLYQFQREFQETLDNSIKICPNFAYAYREKSTAYLKSGDFLTWKKLIDKAVDLAYRPQPFTSEANRMVYLFELYEKYTADLFTTEKKKKK